MQLPHFGRVLSLCCPVFSLIAAVISCLFPDLILIVALVIFSWRCYENKKIRLCLSGNSLRFFLFYYLSLLKLSCKLDLKEVPKMSWMCSQVPANLHCSLLCISHKGPVIPYSQCSNYTPTQVISFLLACAFWIYVAIF